jgi:glycerophosphoryl diester phosphodiesterase
MAMSAPFNLEGHRGARGLRPENTLPSFEAAFDVGVTTVETDLHLTRDGVVVLCHDPVLAGPPWSVDGPGGAPPPGPHPAVSSLTLAELRRYRADRNPDPVRFPHQDPGVTPLARAFCAENRFDPHAVPTLADLFRFAEAYAGEAGRRAGKTEVQRQHLRRLRFDLELKRIPFHPEAINDGFDGRSPGLLERGVLQAVREAGVVARTGVRSFDHRCVRLLREREPGLTGAVLIAHTIPVDPGQLARAAGAEVYCPGYDFVDRDLVRRGKEAGLRVVPWTVNDSAHWERLIGWGVDGITTDFPDLLAAWLRARGRDW